MWRLHQMFNGTMCVHSRSYGGSNCRQFCQSQMNITLLEHRDRNYYCPGCACGTLRPAGNVRGKCIAQSHQTECKYTAHHRRDGVYEKIPCAAHAERRTSFSFGNFWCCCSLLRIAITGWILSLEFARAASHLGTATITTCFDHKSSVCGMHSIVRTTSKH